MVRARVVLRQVRPFFLFFTLCLLVMCFMSGWWVEYMNYCSGVRMRLGETPCSGVHHPVSFLSLSCIPTPTRRDFMSKQTYPKC
jgi:hypothetical protein